MIENGKNITASQHAQVCVMGSGPAGITAAVNLAKAGYDVILLDGSRELNYADNNYYRESWPDKTKLYNGLADGVFTDNEPQFLIQPYSGQTNPAWERERVYGGTSTHWGGQSRPLDAVTFEDRPGFPGWPISRADLDPWYAKVVEFNHLFGPYGTDGTNFTDSYWVQQMKNEGLQAAAPDLNNFNNEMYQFMGRQWLNFAIRTFDGQSLDSLVRVIVNASVLDIVQQGGSIRQVAVASMNDDPSNPQKATEFSVTADVYILAFGAVANARQMLISGIGNEHVGKNFMCHPLTQGNVIQTTENFLTQPEMNLMDGSGWYDPNGNINGITGRFTLDEATAKAEGIGRCWFRSGSKYSGYKMYMEMAPNPKSYVALSSTPDPVFGQPQTHIHWEFSDLDRRTYERNCQLFSESSSKYSSIINWTPWDTLLQQPNSWQVNGHHLGTTRMSASTEPSEGVVDQNLKVHGIDNMFVAGSSVFPTAGVSNPTTTIVTLSLRLADHIAGQIT